MTNIRSYQIVDALREIGTDKCLEKAKELERESSPTRLLNLRNLDLNASNVSAIANCLNEEQEPNNNLLQSISFSYNISLGDLGAMALSKNLPKDISEMGLVTREELPY